MAQTNFIHVVLFLALLKFHIQTVTGKAEQNDSAVFKSLKDSLNQYFIDTWPFKKKFPRFSNLRLDVKDYEAGIDVDGGWTKHTFRLLLKRAIQGKLIKVVVLGSSVSAGAELGCHNNRRTYHYGLSYWWNKTIGAVTGSMMAIHAVTIGGSGTSFYSYCWKDYIQSKEEIDLMLWEPLLIDQVEDTYSRPLERLVRSVVKYWSRPGLIVINFFRSEFFIDYLTGPMYISCQENGIHDLVVNSMVKYYAVTLLSLEKVICNSISKNKTTLTVRDLFSGKHPSALAHAQMTFLITHYIAETLVSFLQILEFDASEVGLTAILNEKEPSLTLPDPIVIMEDDVGINGKCWTAVFLDHRRKTKNSLFDLPVIRNKGFSKIVETDWMDADEVRYDSVGGYQAVHSKRLLALELNIPEVYPTRNQTLLIGVRNKYFGGKVKFSLYDANTATSVAKQYVQTTNDKVAGLQIFEFASVYPGKFVFVVKTITGGVLLSSILLF